MNICVQDFCGLLAPILIPEQEHVNNHNMKQTSVQHHNMPRVFFMCLSCLKHFGSLDLQLSSKLGDFQPDISSSSPLCLFRIFQLPVCQAFRFDDRLLKTCLIVTIFSSVLLVQMPVLLSSLPDVLFQVCNLLLSS